MTHPTLPRFAASPPTFLRFLGDGRDEQLALTACCIDRSRCSYRHETFDAWIATPEREALTASEVHQAVEYHPITRYDLAGGYLNLAGLTRHDPALPSASPKEPS